MTEIDVGTIMDQFVELITYFTSTILGNFISATLDSGVIRSIWVNLFGNASFIKAAFIFALMGGTLLLVSSFSQNSRRSKGNRL